MKIAILFSACLLFSCSAKWHLKQAEKKGAITKTDTVFTDIPVFIEEVKRDSIFFSIPGDTVRIERDRLRVTYVRLPGDSVYIEGECKADTIFQEVPVTITNTIEAKSGFAWWWLVLVGLACIGLGRIFRR
jgi:hypothetical protein